MPGCLHYLIVHTMLDEMLTWMKLTPDAMQSGASGSSSHPAGWS